MSLFKRSLTVLAFFLIVPIPLNSQTASSYSALTQTSIKEVHSTNFGIDQSEVEEIRKAMQTAVDGDLFTRDSVPKHVLHTGL